MDFSKLTDYQLYHLAHSSYLRHEISDGAKKEFNTRQLDIHDMNKIVQKNESLFNFSKVGDSLKIHHKICLMVFPFIIPVHIIVTSRFFSKGQNTKWKQYWFFVSAGYFIWIIIIVIFARIYFMDTE